MARVPTSFFPGYTDAVATSIEGSARQSGLLRGWLARRNQPLAWGISCEFAVPHHNIAARNQQQTMAARCGIASLGLNGSRRIQTGLRHQTVIWPGNPRR